MEKNKCGNFHNTTSSISSTYILSFSPTLPQKHLDKYIVYIFNPQNRQNNFNFISESEELDNWLISTYLLLLRDNDNELRINYQNTIEILMQIRWLDDKIEKYLDIYEWEKLRTFYMCKFDNFYRENLVDHCDATIRISITLDKIEKRIKEEKSFNLSGLAIERLDEIKINERYHSYERNSKFLHELNLNTIQELMNKDEKFKKIVLGIKI